MIQSMTFSIRFRHHGLAARVSAPVMSLVLTLVLGLSTSPYSHADPRKLPSLGDGSSNLISPQLEKEIGESFLKQLHGSMPTVSDPLLKYYVENQIADLAQHSDLREAILSVVVIDSQQINAFAVPGGVIGVNLGLILHAQDVHEYSSVMAHELAHVSQRHFARGVEEQRAQTLPNLASLIAAIALGALGGGEAAVAAVTSAQAASLDRQLRFSREREAEADRIGFNTLVRAGMDPNGMSRMFERMQRAFRFTRRPPEFLLTHPVTEARIADARNQALNMPKRNYQPSLDYQLMRVRASSYYQQNPAHSAEIYRKQLRDQPGNIAASYGLALALSKQGEHEEALSLVELLLNANPQSILYNAAYAELLIEAEQHELAQQLLERQLQLNPDNQPLSMLYAKSLNDQQKHQQAANILEQQTKADPIDVDVWYELAETNGLAGDITGVHLARAEFFYLRGAFQRAIQHLEYAQRLVARTNPQLQTKLAQRIQDLRTEIRERSS